MDDLPNVLRAPLYSIVRKSYCEDFEDFSHLGFRLSFDVCIEGYNAFLDGLVPSMPLDVKIYNQ